jgi:hypothetical protein
MTSAIYIPSFIALAIALVLILADANPFRRPETPMLDQLAAMGLDAPADPLDSDEDFEDPDWQADYEAKLDEQYSGAGFDGDCVHCGLSKAICLCETWTDFQAILNSPGATSSADAIALTGVRR